MILLETEVNQKQLKVELRRAAGRRPMPKIQIAPERFTLSNLVKTFTTLRNLGLECVTNAEVILDDRFEKDESPAECVKALEILEDQRLCGVDKFRSSYYLVGRRFERDELREVEKRMDEEAPKEKPKVRDKGFVLRLRREIEDQRPGWKKKIDEWLIEAKQMY
jgi:hypothetical protein